MLVTTLPIGEPKLVPLEWECNHFGICAAQLKVRDLADDSLAAILREARRQAVRLVVWSAPQGRDACEQLLADFGGTLVDRKAAFCRPLPSGDFDPAPASITATVVPYPSAPASPALEALAISAGVHSRFKVDPHFPSGKFEAMYRQWIGKSVRGEMADAVFVAAGAGERGARHQLVGMITLSEESGIGSIGLIAVSAEARGRGIGSTLIHAAHYWMQNRGAREARVVTQLANVPACRLYERSGYHLATVEHLYHFWL